MAEPQLSLRPQGPTRDPGPFLPHLKCCTYFPFVPNFGLGAMLLDDSPALRVRLKTAEAQGVLLPMGLSASSERQVLSESFGLQGFGQQSELLCPFFDTAKLGCSVWQKRPGVCTTYFCKSDDGQPGLEMWKGVETYLNEFEWKLAGAVFERLGFTEDDMEMCKATMSIDEAGEEREYFARAAWRDWFDRKEELFVKSHETALTFGASEIDALLGQVTLELEADLRLKSFQRA